MPVRALEHVCRQEVYARVGAPHGKQEPTSTPTETTKNQDFCSLGWIVGPFLSFLMMPAVQRNMRLKGMRNLRKNTASDLFEGLVFKLDGV